MSENERIARRKRANEVRLHAIREKSRKTEDRQAQIKESLKGLDQNLDSKKSTHIQFSDSDESDPDAVSIVKDDNLKLRTPNADNLLGFGDEESGDELEIAIKPQFQGKDGEKLLRLQSSYGNDARFRLDERFVDERNESVSFSEDENSHKNGNESKDTKYEEFEKNMKVLSQVIGHDVNAPERTKKKAEKFVSTRRYDPSKEEYLEVKVEMKEKELPKKKKKKKEKVEGIETDPRRFFDASAKTLKNAFAGKTDKDDINSTGKDKPFSFLALLGRPEDSKKDTVTLSKEIGDEAEGTCFNRPSSIGKYIPTLQQKFKYDSSDTEEEDEGETDPNVKMTDVGERSESKIVKELPKEKNWPTTFFLSSPHDPRILDGLRAFCWNKPFEQIQREWLEVKDTLIQDYKKKHRDAKRKERRAKYEARQLAVANET